MTAPRPRRRRLLTLSTAAGVVAATAFGLLAPSSAQAAIRFETVPEAGFWCYSNCAAGGVGRVGRGTLLVPDNEIPGRTIGGWARTFDADCRFNSSNGTRILRGTVRDRLWTGKWEVLQADFKNGTDWQLPWCR